VTLRVLLIDDDIELCSLLTDFLSLEGFAVNNVHDGNEAIEQLRHATYDCVVLDIMLPGLQGLDVLRQLRTFSAVPVLMLTARGEDTDRIVGLELGADDYLPKPCNPRELAARLRAVLRRAKPAAGKVEEISVGSTHLNQANRSGTYNGLDLQLTSAEFNVLFVLLSQAGKVVDKDHISLEALGRHLSAYDRSVDVHVSKIRKKLAQCGGNDLIMSVRGAGYQFVRHQQDQ
jgi:DNA-binding response OmpR family regulator